MIRGFLIAILALATFDGGADEQEPDGDAWYYERIAVQDRPINETEEIPSSWQETWNPFARRARIEFESRLERERELPRLRFELQGDRSNKFALFRCLDAGGDFILTWNLEVAKPLDDVFLLPTRIPQADGTIRRLGFPEKSRLELSERGDFQHDVRVVEVPESSEEGSTGFPLRIPLDGKPARAWRWIIEEPYAPFGIGYLALSEIFVLSGNTNVSTQATLSWSDGFLPDRSMAPTFLQDEKTPLGLPLVREETSVLGYHSEIKELTEKDEEWIELRWSEPKFVKAIRLIPSQQRVLPHTETFGFPLAHRTEFFRGSEEIGNRRVRYEIDPGQNVVSVRGFPDREVDRVRWMATELWQRRDSRFLSLAEFEVIDSTGKNIAAGAEIEVSSMGVENAIWNLGALTDGLASEGRLVSTGEWLRGLDEAKRVREDRLVYAAVLKRAVRFTDRVLFILLLVVLFSVAVGFAISWRQTQRQAKAESLELRQQLAADLHDDLGGNLGSIVLLADQVKSSQSPGSEPAVDLDRVVELARESRNRLKTILEVGDKEIGLPVDANSFSHRLRLIVRDFFGEQHGFLTFPDDDEGTINSLSLAQRDELLMFCKEALHNLRQHSDVTRVLVQLEPCSTGVRICIEDDSSIPLTKNGGLSSRSLRRRSQKLAAKVRVEELAEGKGNILTLELPARFET